MVCSTVFLSAAVAFTVDRLNELLDDLNDNPTSGAILFLLAFLVRVAVAEWMRQHQKREATKRRTKANG